MRLRNLCVMFGVLVFVLSTPFAAMAGWVIETVDSKGIIGIHASLALDTAGKPHISYHDWTNANLKYAYYDGGAWQTETVDTGREGGRYPSLALDASGKPHISYLHTYNRIKYAYYDGASWQTETVEDYTGDSGSGSSSLALDSSGRPHISYSFVTYQKKILKYAYHDGVSWNIETVDSEGLVGSYNSLALDTSGRPHISYISYIDIRNADLKYAYYDGVSWQIETVDSETHVSNSTSLELDTAGRPHISYYGDNSLKYAYYDGASWRIETIMDSAIPVSGTNVVGMYTSLALDTAGRPHISYYANSGYADAMKSSYGDMKYAYYDGISWNIETVDNEENVGWWASLALDSSDNPHISYYDWTNYDLKYAYKLVPNPDITASPAFYDFGSVQKRKSSPPVTFTISNTGNADLVIGGVYLTGTNPYQFIIRNDACSDQTIAPSGSCTIEAIFSPTKTGTFNALIGIDSNDPDTPTLNIELTGTGVMGHMKNKGH
ncbi:MAG TPA: choice-of-anchor D domain-containing protein [Nitrospirae bacterium]|nr:choice-of-anchor D domain-containing protein [Nitrospirota bacterium]